MFAVRLSNKAEKQFLDLEQKYRDRVIELFKKLEQAPVPAKEYDLKKIKGEEDCYRIRLSRFRVLYQVFREEKTVRITKIERRSEGTYD